MVHDTSMKRPALLFIAAVLVPALVLGGLVLRSLQDQRFVLERQQSLLAQGVADKLAGEIAADLAELQREFAAEVENAVGTTPPRTAAANFDPKLRAAWPMADVGFVVDLAGQVLAPPLTDARAVAREFRIENDLFLCNRVSVEVYANSPNKGQVKLSQVFSDGAGQTSSFNTAPRQSQVQRTVEPLSQGVNQSAQLQSQSVFNKSPAQGNAEPVQQREEPPKQQLVLLDNNQSKLWSAEAEFRQLVSGEQEGVVARFLQNRLRIMLWYRTTRDPVLVFGAQLDLPKLTQRLRDLVKLDPALEADFSLALLNDAAQPVGVSPAGTPVPNWRRPFAAAEIGEALPHGEAAVYLTGGDRLNATAATLRWSLLLLVAVLLAAIAGGGALLVIDGRRQLRLAQQKTDFVSNVSHELKTPLTSIRMFSDLLAEGRVQDEARVRHYLGVISGEAARLTRLVNNVLDFSRAERGERRLDQRPLDLAELARETALSLRPHLESIGLRLELRLPESPLQVSGDRDALSQVLLNLLSNAEKYAASGGVVEVGAAAERGRAVLRVLDRGPGVPVKLGERIFEKFFRADDALASGVQGTGLGLTLARQIAEGHGGALVHSPREGGGSCFTLTLPMRVEKQ